MYYYGTALSSSALYRRANKIRVSFLFDHHHHFSILLSRAYAVDVPLQNQHTI